MSILRIGFITLALVLCGTWWAASQTPGPDWMHWQRLYQEARAALEEDPARADSWQQRPLSVRQVEVTAQLNGPGPREVRAFRGFARETCITCHEGIEPMSPSHPESFGCTVCHGGDGDVLDKNQAHASLIFDPQSGTGRRNPSALSVVHLSCGQIGCHSGFDDPGRNHVDRVRRSIMGTLAGVIGGVRYSWSAQARPQARYGVHPVEPLPGSSDPGLEALPFFTPGDLARAQEKGIDPETRKVSHHPADGLLRSTCFQCHLDGAPPEGQFRGQGCAACHVPYSDAGLYEGLDVTIDKKKSGHMSRHRLVALPEQRACLQCHKTFERPAADAETRLVDPELIPPKGRPVEDAHFQAGLECIDCHPSADVMGDGRITSRQYEAVTIGCETCHGSPERHPGIAQVNSGSDPVLRENRHYKESPVKNGDWLVVSKQGAKLSNVKVHNGRITLFSKRTGMAHAVSLVKESASHPIARHNEKLACTACHSAWVPQCTGCHLTFDQAGNAEKPWSPFQFELSYSQPTLMVGPDGKVRPMLPQPLRTLTALDAKGHPMPVINDGGDVRGHYRGFTFTNPRGYSGGNLAFATHPHSVTRKVRPCASCHTSPSALGLGDAELQLSNRTSGKSDRAVPAVRDNPFGTRAGAQALAQVTPRGEAVAGSHQPEARPFNQEELTRILRVGNCLPCHARQDDPIYQNIDSSYRKANTNKHRQLMQTILEAR